MDAFIYSPYLLETISGTTYSNLFHVSDWFPTLLDFANIEFTAKDGYSLDGVSHFEAITGGNGTAPREYMLYNSYHNIYGIAEQHNYARFVNQTFAVRNSQ